MTRKAKEIWKCGCCSEEFDDDVEARLCCAPTPEACWACPECNKAHSIKAEAEKCCNASLIVSCPNCRRDYGPSHINALAIELAGHCNTCNPHFTLDQRFTIEHQLERIDPWGKQSLM